MTGIYTSAFDGRLQPRAKVLSLPFFQERKGFSVLPSAA